MFGAQRNDSVKEQQNQLKNIKRETIKMKRNSINLYTDHEVYTKKLFTFIYTNHKD